MRKLSLVLAVLLSTTVSMANVRIIVESEGTTAAVRYETDGEKVRAFALDITVDKGTILGISDFVRGESTAANPGYGIFPGNFARYITVNADTGEVTSWDPNGYTPVADPCDPEALGGLGTSGITVEMGALYYPTGDDSENAPPNSGLLFKLMLSEAANVSVALNEARGGIVLTNPETEAVPDLNQAKGIAIAGVVEEDEELLASTHPDYAEWVAVGKPACWAYPRQCHGDADGRKETSDSGSYYVGVQDLNLLVAAWEVKEAPFGPGIASVTNGICADFAHDQDGSAATGYFRVGVTDLNILVANWLVKEAPDGPGVAGDCGGTLTP
ncbi:MAG: hypothetical protein KBE65_04865 [Phycisphaerae bacterium]|nr:hypothetical protein [Phycisphaerae bacterium]